MPLTLITQKFSIKQYSVLLNFWFWFRNNFSSWNERSDEVEHSWFFNAYVDSWQCTITTDLASKADESDLNAVTDNRTAGVTVATVSVESDSYKNCILSTESLHTFHLRLSCRTLSERLEAGIYSSIDCTDRVVWCPWKLVSRALAMFRLQLVPSQLLWLDYLLGRLHSRRYCKSAAMELESHSGTVGPGWISR